MNSLVNCNQSRVMLATVLAVLIVLCGMVVFTPIAHAESDVDANVIFGHMAPFAESNYRSRVDVRIDGQDIATELTYLGLVEKLTWSFGEHEVFVDPLEWPGYTYTGTVEIIDPAGSGFVEPIDMIAIVGGSGSIPLSIFHHWIEGAEPDTNSLIRMTNLAAYSVNGDTEYTICNTDGTVFNDMSMIGYGESSKYIEVTPGTYTIYVSGSYSSCDERLTSDLILILQDNSVADLYSVGTNVNPEFVNSVTIISESATILRPRVFLSYLKK